MATEVRIRRGTTAQHASFTGAAAEITVDTDKDTIVVHDGVTVGGFPLGKETDLSSKASSGANSDITSLSGLTTPLSIAQGGTGGNSGATARTALGAAASGALGSSGITGAAAAGANSDITSLSGLTTAISGSGLGSKIQPITASVAANALTVTVNPTTMDFRSATLGSGTVNSRTLSVAASLVISSGSTLGTVNAIQSRIAVLLIDNTGTLEVAAVNVSGGTDLSETGLISTTAEGGVGGADSASVIYSTTARASLPYRVVGYVDSTQATAGTWAAAPSTIQGAGGNAVTAMSSLGHGQNWQTFTVGSARVFGTTYYNTTGKPIQVSLTSTNSAGTSGGGIVNGVTIQVYNYDVGVTPVYMNFIVPPNASYSITTTSGSHTGPVWAELR